MTLEYFHLHLAILSAGGKLPLWYKHNPAFSVGLKQTILLDLHFPPSISPQ